MTPTSHHRTVALIGTSHTYQRPGHATEGEFRRLINQACASLKVRAIAEEASLEALAQKHASHSICEEIAKTAGLSHRYCDPNNEQRNALNIRGKQDIEWEGFCDNWSPERIQQEVAASHAIRERYWCAELVHLDCWPLLFVCGADHIDSFCAILKNEDFHVDVIVRDWPTG
jgi:hypothetical protein